MLPQTGNRGLRQRLKELRLLDAELRAVIVPKKIIVKKPGQSPRFWLRRALRTLWSNSCLLIRRAIALTRLP